VILCYAQSDKHYYYVPMRKITKLLLGMFMLLAIAGPPGSLHAQSTANQPPSATLKGDRAHPAHGQHWVDTRLYFGLGPADAPKEGVSEAMWRDFLDKEVTPRFPAGLSVMDIYGQWQGKQEKAPERIRSKVLIIDYPATAENAAKIEAIRLAWKQKTGDQSVMKVTQAASVSF
jgi:hypothetical protein